MHFDEWKLVDEDMYYDWRLVRKVRKPYHAAHDGESFNRLGASRFANL